MSDAPKDCNTGTLQRDLNVAVNAAQVLSLGLDTPYKAHFQTNNAPSSYEAQAIAVLLQNPRDNINLLDSHIEAMKNARDLIASFIDDHIPLLSPIRRVTDDVLNLVFHECLSDNIFPQQEVVPLTLSAVCRRWRVLVRDSPQLWSQIYVSIPALQIRSQWALEEFQLQLENIQKCLQMWLDRSGQVPLAITIRVADQRGYNGPEAAELLAMQCRIVQLLVPSAHRWRAISLAVPHYMKDVLSLVQVEQLKHFRQLELLPIFHLYDSPSASHFPIPESLFLPTSLVYLANHTDYPTPQCRWEHLADLHLSPQSYSGAQQSLLDTKIIPIIATASKTLKRCSIDIWLTKNHFVWTEIVFTKLEHFDITIHSNGLSLAEVMERLKQWDTYNRTPNLKHLSICHLSSHSEPEQSVWPEWPFFRWLGMQEQEKLGSIELHVKMTPTVAMQCFTSLGPRVRTLSLFVGPTETLSFLLHIFATVDPWENTVCPSLLHLVVGSSDIEDDELDHLILTFAERRRFSTDGVFVANLETLNVIRRFLPRQREIFMGRVEAMRKDGLNITWQYQDDRSTWVHAPETRLFNTWGVQAMVSPGMRTV
ncbi:hypothetical protein VNI00_011181 [Paramarasmius palmivorus]|uniref:F-box domain-containing protein n=1 Tax=Paramarasmius palmivorus TaxID=297713 RepID=A0AAW0CEZ1_9AGAR